MKSPLFLFNPLLVPELRVRNSGWNVVKEAGENQGEVGWDQARRVNQSRPVGRAPTTLYDPWKPTNKGGKTNYRSERPCYTIRNHFELHARELPDR